MKLTDTAPVEEWEQLERELAERFGLNTSVTDDAGSRITSYDNFCNKLCERIKGDPKGRGAICSVAGQYFASQICKTGQPLVEECDAGLTKIAVPIIIDGVVLGNVGLCGLLLDGEEVDTFMVARSLDVVEQDLQGQLGSIPTMTLGQANEIKNWIVQRLKKLPGGVR